MKDFKNGRDINVNGNFNILDNSTNNNKLLHECTNDELKYEIRYKQENIRLEQSRKIKRFRLLYILITILFILAASSALYFGFYNLQTLLLGIITIILGAITLDGTIKDNNFQLENREDIKYIKNILKHRRSE